MEDSRSAGQAGRPGCVVAASPLPACPVQSCSPPHLSLLIMYTGREVSFISLPYVVNPYQQLGQRWQERSVSALWGFCCGAGQQPGAWGRGG